ncbi:Uncharacterised protein [[Clostridium] sordellii]|nr:hypothetical protein [Paeniclostridium sordellii]CEQ20886.1 Uncharacterised protein [[Clostridium] sordellii] [Paeniclostridium sordellii]
MIQKILYIYEIDYNKYIKCDLCCKKCDMNVVVRETPNSIESI